MGGFFLDPGKRRSRQRADTVDQRPVHRILGGRNIGVIAGDHRARMHAVDVVVDGVVGQGDT
ncbi:hypothetical protein, partial [Nocardia cyriacigeorgica]|uniref:hypothetical protein n=1 Tax=Nocardia cyriacigeorgica TaxID=135487 RepID=UPI0024549EAA